MEVKLKMNNLKIEDITTLEPLSYEELSQVVGGDRYNNQGKGRGLRGLLSRKYERFSQGRLERKEKFGCDETIEIDPIESVACCCDPTVVCEDPSVCAAVLCPAL